MDEYKDKIPQNVADEVSGKIEAVKKALEGNDSGRIRTAKEELETRMQHIGEAMAKAAGAAGGAQHGGEHAGSGHAGSHGESSHQQQQQGGHKGKGDDDIEEAEVEIIDDKQP